MNHRNALAVLAVLAVGFLALLYFGRSEKWKKELVMSEGKLFTSYVLGNCRVSESMDGKTLYLSVLEDYGHGMVSETTEISLSQSEPKVSSRDTVFINPLEKSPSGNYDRTVLPLPANGDVVFKIRCLKLATKLPGKIRKPILSALR